MLEHLHCFYFSLGYDVRLKQFQVGQTLITVGHCPMTDAYFQPCLFAYLFIYVFIYCFQLLNNATYKLGLTGCARRVFTAEGKEVTLFVCYAQSIKMSCQYPSQLSQQLQPFTKIIRLFYLLAQFPFTLSETELDYYHQKLNVRVAK